MNQGLYFFSILYNPSENAFLNIKSAIDAGYEVCVYINRVSPEDIDKLNLMNVKMLGDNVNKGLGSAFYEMEKLILRKGEGNYLYFDQDTVVKSSVFDTIKNRAVVDLDKADRGFVFYSSQDSEIFKSGFFPSSGCLFRVKQDSLFHDNTFFVECVDYEYTCRVRAIGGKIRVVTLPGIDHDSLQDVSTKSVFGLNFKFRIYPLTRVMDFNKSHLKLIAFSLRNFQISSMLFLCRSLIAFNINNLKSHFLDKI